MYYYFLCNVKVSWIYPSLDTDSQSFKRCDTHPNRWNWWWVETLEIRAWTLSDRSMLPIFGLGRKMTLDLSAELTHQHQHHHVGQYCCCTGRRRQPLASGSGSDEREKGKALSCFVISPPFSQQPIEPCTHELAEFSIVFSKLWSDEHKGHFTFGAILLAHFSNYSNHFLFHI